MWGGGENYMFLPTNTYLEGWNQVFTNRVAGKQRLGRVRGREWDVKRRIGNGPKIPSEKGEGI